MPFNTDHWDSMRQYEERIQELREQAEEEGIELSEASVNAAMSFLSNLTPAQGGENPSRLLKHRDPGRLHTGQLHTGRPHTGQLHTGRPHTGRLHTGRPHRRVEHPAPAGLSGSAPTAPHANAHREAAPRRRAPGNRAHRRRSISAKPGGHTPLQQQVPPGGHYPTMPGGPPAGRRDPPARPRDTTRRGPHPSTNPQQRPGTGPGAHLPGTAGTPGRRPGGGHQPRPSWTFRISSGVSEGIYNSEVQSDWEFLNIGVGGGQ